MGLCCWLALRGLWGFCAREWLGGLEDCCVFASILSLSHPFFIFFAYLLGICLCCPRLVLLPALFVLVSLWVFVCVVVSFSLTDYMQKERAQRFCPCVLSDCFIIRLNSCIVIEVFLCRCFGFFQFARLIPPTNTSSIRRLARSHFDFLRHYVNIANNPPAFLK